MKIQTPAFRTVSFAQVKTNQECIIRGVRLIKVRDKLAMTPQGHVVPVANNEKANVRVK